MRRPIPSKQRSHMVRRLLPWILPTLCALMVLAIVFFWIRTWFVTDCLRKSHITASDNAFHRREICLMTVRGGITTRTWTSITATLDPPDAEIAAPMARTYSSYTYSTAPPWHPLDSAGGPATFAEHLGFVRRPGIKVIPIWPAAILVSGIFLPLLRRWCIRIHRTQNGLCLVCGYDLRASKDRCPECGTTFAARRCPVPQH